MALYSKVEYWNDRYLKSSEKNLPPYDWYQNYNTLAHLLNPETLSGCSVSAHQLGVASIAEDDSSVSTTTMTNASAAKAYACLHPHNCRILILGCGNSTFGANMYEAGWQGGTYSEEARFVQVDFSPVVIEQMQMRYDDGYYNSLLGTHNTQSAPRMEFMCCDITKPPLPFENGSFDLIICKGVFDAILCSVGSTYSIRRMIKECVRLLNDNGGVLMICSYGNPDNRVEFLEDGDGDLQTYWQGVSVHTVPSMVRARQGGNHSSNKNDYVYLCRKKTGAWKESMTEDFAQPAVADNTSVAATKGEAIAEEHDETENKPNPVVLDSGMHSNTAVVANTAAPVSPV